MSARAEVVSFVAEGLEVVVVDLPHRPLPWDRLTPAERAVAALAGEGRSDREIAAARGVSVRTVQHQLTAVYRKLGVASRFELAALGQREA